MRKIEILALLLIISNIFTFSCKTSPDERGGKSKISGICRAQKTFFKKNARYGTLEELVDAKLIDDIWFRNYGFTQDN